MLEQMQKAKAHEARLDDRQRRVRRREAQERKQEEEEAAAADEWLRLKGEEAADDGSEEGSEEEDEVYFEDPLPEGKRIGALDALVTLYSSQFAQDLAEDLHLKQSYEITAAAGQ